MFHNQAAGSGTTAGTRHDAGVQEGVGRPTETIAQGFVGGSPDPRVDGATLSGFSGIVLSANENLCLDMNVELRTGRGAESLDGCTGMGEGSEHRDGLTEVAQNMTVDGDVSVKPDLIAGAAENPFSGDQDTLHNPSATCTSPTSHARTTTILPDTARSSTTLRDERSTPAHPKSHTATLHAVAARSIYNRHSSTGVAMCVKEVSSHAKDDASTSSGNEERGCLRADGCTGGR